MTTMSPSGAEPVSAGIASLSAVEEGVVVCAWAVLANASKLEPKNAATARMIVNPLSVARSLPLDNKHRL
ncbi:hypothetical protein [Sphingomonas sp. CCH9-F2]|uniref:hypothetical protein n=1 Tax=Sphingomonas sp. CCH9-F2 TaxID=1768778 RepID=UPI0018D268A6|nr:hypothetical protein [Sphingomonas sp. CCH9-F2]